MTASLKEHLKSAPKELARRGLGDGADRLRTQLQDAAQDGRTDDNGGDKLEDAAAGGLRRAARGAEQLLKQKRGQSAERPGTVKEKMEPDSPTRTEAESPRIKTAETLRKEGSTSYAPHGQEPQGTTADQPIKTRETVQAEPRSGAVDSTRTDPIRPPARTREAMQQAAPVGGEIPHTRPTAPAIKAKDAYIQRQPAASSTRPPQEAGGERIGARGRGAAKEVALRRRGPTGADVAEPAAREVLPDEAAPSPGQRAVPLQKTVRENGAANAQSSRRLSDTLLTAHRTAPRPTGRESLQTVKTAEQRGRQVVKAAERPIKAAGISPKTVQAAGRTTGTAIRARQAASARQSVTRTRQAARAAGTTAKKTVRAAGRALRAILSAARGLAAAIAAGGGVVFTVILLICLIGFLMASPFGLFFSGENSGTGYTMPDAVVLFNGEFGNRIEQIKAENPYDTLDLDNAGSAAMISNWDDVLAVYAVHTSMSADAPEEVATLTEEKLSILREIFWDMNAISYWVEVIPGGEDEDDTTILHITVTVKDYLQMADEYGFTAEQRELLAEMMGPEYQELFMALTGSYRDLTLTPEQVREIIKNLPTNLSDERRQVVLTAYQLLGKINYFWGGKSLVLGWDSRWGTPMEVWAAGSSTTGSVRPFGMDCSGFTDWVFYNVSDGEYILGHGGGASAQHSYCAEISWEEAIPGDLVFYPGDMHVGIVCGFDADGNILVIHCAYSANNVVVTGKSGFTTIGRPVYFSE